jgi:poly(glycerol-phosphate) alpha-glucosyltransferase
MLDEWALRNGRWKKQLAAAVYERDCLSRAGCIHAFTQAELASTRKFGLKNPICVIPNGVDIPETSGSDAPWTDIANRGIKTLLYLGRIHPKKNLPALLRAWSSLIAEPHAITSDWRLVIAGWDQKRHERELKSLARSLQIEQYVRFVGPLFGDAKSAAFNHADVIVLPSLSEGLPMVVLEAWAHAKPVLMTPQCNLPEGFAAGAAASSQPDADSLALGLKDLLSASDSERRVMGARGLALVQQKFTWPLVASQMHSVYSWLVGGGNPPDCVVCS